MSVTEELEADLNSAIEETVAADESAAANEGGNNEGERKVDGEGPVGDGGGESSHAGEENIEHGEMGGDNDGGEEAGGEGGEAEGGTKMSAEKHEVVLSDSVVAAAVNAGIPASVALGMESDAQLMGLVDSVRETLIPKEEKKEEVDLFADLPELDPETYGEAAIETLQKLTGIIKKQQEQLDGLRDSHGELLSAADRAEQGVQNGAAREIEGWFDSKIGELGDDYAEALGAGGYGDQAEGSSQFAKRDAIAQNMAVMLAGYKASGIDAPPRDEVFQSAVKFVLGDDIARINEGNLSEKLSKRSKQHISRAGGQQTKIQNSAEDETARLLDEKFFGK